jgi:uridine phosphorylase
MTASEAIVNPIKGKNSPDPGSLAFLIGTLVDFNRLCRVMELPASQSRPLFISRMHPQTAQLPGVSLTGPIVGAPYAVMILETLIAWGARRFIFFGWCGAISPDVKIGDILIPSAAIIDEGTSGHYSDGDVSRSQPSAVITTELKSALDAKAQSFHEGPVWTTDAIFRETKDKVRHFSKQGALAVDMELSALYTVAEFRGVDIGGILVVSDELSSLQWRPGFRDERFEVGRTTAYEAIKQLCREE